MSPQRLSQKWYVAVRSRDGLVFFLKSEPSVISDVSTRCVVVRHRSVRHLQAKQSTFLFEYGTMLIDRSRLLDALCKYGWNASCIRSIANHSVLPLQKWATLYYSITTCGVTRSGRSLPLRDRTKAICLKWAFGVLVQLIS